MAEVAPQVEGPKAIRRRGTALKAKKGTPAVFVPSMFNTEEAAKLINLWWVNGAGRNYMVRSDDSGEWSQYPEDKVRALLCEWLVRPTARKNEKNSEVTRVLLHAMRHRRLERSLPALAGYPAGVHNVYGKQILIRTGPRLIIPSEGDWGIVQPLIESKLGSAQAVFFHAWMRTAIEALHAGPGNNRPGQLLIFAGPRDSGKSRLQHQIITPLLGGRCADPGPYLFGTTDFNSELAGAEHLMIEDPAGSTRTEDRIRFGERLKGLLVNDTQRLHRKGEDAMVVAPCWRATLSLNNDPDKMRVLPLFTPDIRDKVHLFQISAGPLPMPTSTLEERAEFRRVITLQLPAYSWWLLNEFDIPAEIRSDRFGVEAYLNQDLLFELTEDTPSHELLRIIDEAEFVFGDPPRLHKLWEIPTPEREGSTKTTGDTWEGPGSALERLLVNEREWSGCTQCDRARKLLKSTSNRTAACQAEGRSPAAGALASNKDRARMAYLEAGGGGLIVRFANRCHQ